MKKWLLGCISLGWCGAVLASPTELHWRVCETGTALLQKLPSPQKERQRWTAYFDDSNLAHYHSGVILRFRWDKKKGGTSTVKLRGFSHIPGDWEDLNGYKCEKDYRGSQLTSTCSLKRKVPGTQATAFLKGHAHPGTLFDGLQRRFLGAARKGVHWKALRVAGPVPNRQWKWKGFEGEEIRLKSGKTYVELSLRTRQGVKTEYRRWKQEFERRGIQFCPQSPSKTYWVLGNLLN